MQYRHFVILIAIFLLGPMSSNSLEAAHFYVNSIDDLPDANPGDGVCETVPGNGICTLRAAVMEANARISKDTIHLPPGVYKLTRAGNGMNDDALYGDLDINWDLDLIGTNPNTTIINGNGIDRIFDIHAVPVNITGITMTNGKEGMDTQVGGGIRVDTSVVSLTNCIISYNVGFGIANIAGVITLDNAAIVGNKGGIFNAENGSIYITHSNIYQNQSIDGGGIYNQKGNLTILNSTINNNWAARQGGGISSSEGNSTITDSNITNNTAEFAGGGIHVNTGTITIKNSTLNDNEALQAGGGIWNEVGTINIVNSTIFRNSAGHGGGAIYQQTATGTTSLYNTTVCYNNTFQYPSHGGGICNHTGTVNIRNTILARNYVPEQQQGSLLKEENCFGTLTSQSFNLISDTAGCTLAPWFDLLGVDPKLGWIGNHGGFTQTIPLLYGSPAIDAGAFGGCTDNVGNLLTTDQRGSPRDVDGNDDGIKRCDIGAFEFIPQVFLPLILR